MIIPDVYSLYETYDKFLDRCSLSLNARNESTMLYYECSIFYLGVVNLSLIELT